MVGRMARVAMGAGCQGLAGWQGLEGLQDAKGCNDCKGWKGCLQQANRQ